MLPRGPGSTASMYFGAGQVGRDWIRAATSFDGVSVMNATEDFPNEAGNLELFRAMH